ncbi:LysR family transcriptional regulator [Segnochrobactraceae bacterium EtOH-i3]
MTLEQLRIFVAVAEHEHVTRAARALNLTQSATSAAVAALEGRHAVRLFDRVGRRIELTDAGRVFLAEARAVLARAAAAEAVLSDLSGLRRGHLALAASQTVGTYWLPPLLSRFRAAHPGIEVSLAITNTGAVCGRVLAGEADLGFIEGPADEPGLTARPVATDALVLVVAADRPLPAEWAGTPAELSRLPWVFREAGSATRALFEEGIAGLGVDPQSLPVVLELPSNEAVLSAVIAGAGAAALSRLVVAGALATGSVRVLDITLPERPFLAIHGRERPLSGARRAFLDLAVGA